MFSQDTAADRLVEGRGFCDRCKYPWLRQKCVLCDVDSGSFSFTVVRGLRLLVEMGLLYGKLLLVDGCGRPGLGSAIAGRGNDWSGLV